MPGHNSRGKYCIGCCYTKFLIRLALGNCWKGTWGVLEWRKFEYSKYTRVLDAAYNKGISLFGDAYRPNQRYRLDLQATHSKYLALLVHVMDSDVLARLLDANSYEQCFWILRGLPLVGDFTGMQFLSDLNYSGLLEFDEDSYIRVGPGAMKGINVRFGTTLSDKRASDMLKAAEVVQHCTDRQEHNFQNLGLEPVTLFGQRRLKLIDVQNLYCEFFKSSKLKFPNFRSEGATVKPYDPAKARARTESPS
jgi:hypothetical protein